MTTPSAAIELNVLERGEAHQPAPQQPVTWCGRQVKLLPAYLAGLACLFALGTMAYEIEKKNWVAVGLCGFVAVAVAIVTYCYLRNIPIRTVEQSAEDIQRMQQVYTTRIREFETIENENKKTITKLESDVKNAGEERQRLETTLDKNQTELKDVTKRLEDTLERMHVISTQFREGVSELAKKVMKFTNDGNKELIKQVSEIASMIANMDQLSVKVSEGSRILKVNNDQLDTKIQDYKKLLAQLGTVVDVILPDYEAHKASEKEFEEMRAQNAAMQKQINELKDDIVELERTKATFFELQKLSENLSNPKMIEKLSELLKT